jgi:hypothetical protein
MPTMSPPIAMRARRVTSEDLPDGQSQFGSLCRDDLLSLLEKFEPQQYNRIELEHQPDAVLSCCVAHALGRSLHDKVPHLNRMHAKRLLVVLPADFRLGGPRPSTDHDTIVLPTPI